MVFVVSQKFDPQCNRYTTYASGLKSDEGNGGASGLFFFGGGGVYAGIRRMLTCKFLKRRIHTGARAQLYFYGRKGVYTHMYFYQDGEYITAGHDQQTVNKTLFHVISLRPVSSSLSQFALTFMDPSIEIIQTKIISLRLSSNSSTFCKFSNLVSLSATPLHEHVDA
jgi:hypothetical protein